MSSIGKLNGYNVEAMAEEVKRAFSSWEEWQKKRFELVECFRRENVDFIKVNFIEKRSGMEPDRLTSHWFTHEFLEISWLLVETLMFGKNPWPCPKLKLSPSVPYLDGLLDRLESRYYRKCFVEEILSGRVDEDQERLRELLPKLPHLRGEATQDADIVLYQLENMGEWGLRIAAGRNGKVEFKFDDPLAQQFAQAEINLQELEAIHATIGLAIHWLKGKPE